VVTISVVTGAAVALGAFVPALESVPVWVDELQPSKQRLAAANTDNRSEIIIIAATSFGTASLRVKLPDGAIWNRWIGCAAVCLFLT